MAGFNVTITTPDVSFYAGGLFGDFWAILAVKKAPVEKEIKRLLDESAKDGHKLGNGRHYENQTGQLRDATYTIGNFGMGESTMVLQVDQDEAPYAKYIIEEKYFDDPFIDEAMEHNFPEITQMIIDLYSDAIMECEVTRR